MRNLLLTTLAVSVAGLSFAGDIAKDYQKLIKKCDVVKEARWVKSDMPEEFWTVSLNNDAELARFNKDIQKDGGAQKEAKKAMLKLPHFYPEYNDYVVAGLQNYCDSLVSDMGLDNLGVDFTFNIIRSPQANVFSAPTEDGFVICVTEGLYRDKNMNDDIMKGYVAHEFAHGALRHQLRFLFREAKKKRSDRVWGSVILGVALATEATMDYLFDDYYTTPIVYTEPLFPDYEAEKAAVEEKNLRNASKKVIDDLNANLKNGALLYSFNFSPNQVYAADLMAFRFLQNIGAADSYSEGLKILGTRYDAQFASTPDHPSVAQRINFLKYVEENPGYTRED